MDKGSLSDGTYRIRGLKAHSVGMRENLLTIEMKNKTRTVTGLELRGIIAFTDKGTAGKSLSEFTIEDKGSFRILSIFRPNGNRLFVCEFMECKAV